MNPCYSLPWLLMMFSCAGLNLVESYFSCPTSKYDVSAVLGSNASDADFRLLASGLETSIRAQMHILAENLAIGGRPDPSLSGFSQISHC